MIETMIKALEMINTLAKFTEYINEGLNLNEVLDKIYESFYKIIPYDRMGMALISEDGITVKANWMRSNSLEIKLGSGFTEILKNSSLKNIIDTGTPRILNDLEEYVKNKPESESTKRILAEGIKSSLTCPLVANGKHVGFLFFSSKEKEIYKNTHIELFKQIAGQVSLIIEKSMLYQRLDDVNKMINTLANFTEYINEGLNLNEVLDKIYESFYKIIPYDRIGMALITEDGNSVKAHWMRSNSVEIKLNSGFTEELKNSSLKNIIDTGTPRILNDLDEYVKNKPESESTKRILAEGIKSSLTCPLVANGKHVGFLFFSSKEKEIYKNAHIELFKQIAGQASLIIEKSMLYQRLDDVNKMINTLAKLTEYINAGLNLSGVLDKIYDSFYKIIPYDRIGMALITEDGSRIKAHWMRSNSIEIKLGSDFTEELKNSSLKNIIDTRTPRILNDLEEYAKNKPKSESTKRILAEGIMSSLTCPLVANGKPVGFLFFSSKEKEIYKNAHIELFKQIAGQVSLIIEKSMLYQKLDDVNKMINTLAKLTEYINAGLNLNEVLDKIYESFYKIIPYDRMGMALITENGSKIRAHWMKSNSIEIKLGSDFTEELKNSSLKNIIDTRTPRILNDLEEYAKNKPESESTKRILAEGIMSSLTCPLVANGKHVGFLFFSSKEKEIYKNAHIELFKQIAGQVSLIIEKSMLYQKLDDAKKTINTLAKFTEYINEGLNLNEVLDKIYESFYKIIPYDRMGMALITEDGNSIKANWMRSNSAEIKLGSGFTEELKNSSLKNIIDTRTPRILNNLEEYVEKRPESESTKRILAEGIMSSLTCPLVANGKHVGFLFFSSKEKEIYKNAHIELFKQIAGQVSLIIEKSMLYQKLDDANKLKNKFLGITAHDLRSPLTVIKGFLDLFIMGHVGEITEQQKSFMEKMKKHCEHMLEIINDLLDYSAIETGHLELKLQEVDLNKFLIESCESNNFLAQSKSICIIPTIDKDLPNVIIDPIRINQVLNNIITNAIKFSHSETEIQMIAKRDGDYVRVIVKDQGVGIPENELPKIFKAFSQSSAKSTAGEKGTGLGLAIVKRIIDAHNGEIIVQTKVGKGSEFIIKLPISGPKS